MRKKKPKHMREQVVAEQRVRFQKVREVNCDTDVQRLCTV